MKGGSFAREGRAGLVEGVVSRRAVKQSSTCQGRGCQRGDESGELERVGLLIASERRRGWGGGEGVGR